MYNIKALEEDWKRYSRRKKRPWYVLFILLIIMIFVIMWFSLSGIKFDFGIPSEKHQEHVVSTHQEKIYLDGSLQGLEEKKNRQPVDAPMETPNVIENNLNTSAGMSPKPIKKLHIEVVEAGRDSQSLKDVAKRFRLGHDTDDSLFLAKSYYKRKNYKKAEYWALQTNKINNNIEDSWLIFVKSKVKQGHRNEAIRILNNYINRTRSVEAKVLLEKIKTGKRI